MRNGRMGVSTYYARNYANSFPLCLKLCQHNVREPRWNQCQYLFLAFPGILPRQTTFSAAISQKNCTFSPAPEKMCRIAIFLGNCCGKIPGKAKNKYALIAPPTHVVLRLNVTRPFQFFVGENLGTRIGQNGQGRDYSEWRTGGRQLS